MKHCNSSPPRRIARDFTRVAVAILSVLLLATTQPALAQSAHDPNTSAASSLPQVDWYTDLDEALAEAKVQNKLVLLRFTANWCAPCRVMDARVWPDSGVQSALTASYLAVKNDIDVEASHAAMRRYGVQAVPTLILLDAQGNELDRGGFMSPPKTIKFLDAAAGTKDEFDKQADATTKDEKPPG